MNAVIQCRKSSKPFIYIVMPNHQGSSHEYSTIRCVSIASLFLTIVGLLVQSPRFGTVKMGVTPNSTARVVGVRQVTPHSVECCVVVVCSFGEEDFDVRVGIWLYFDKIKRCVLAPGFERRVDGFVGQLLTQLRRVVLDSKFKPVVNVQLSVRKTQPCLDETCRFPDSAVSNSVSRLSGMKRLYLMDANY